MLRRAAVSAAVALLLGPLTAAGPWVAHAADGSSVVCHFSDDRLTEISGMTLSLRHRGVLWMHNDSSGGPFLYAVDAETCRTRARIEIAGIDARDIEGIATGRDSRGRPVLWVADVGDNLDSWADVRLHLLREPKRLIDQTVTARTYRYTYADRPHNAETLLADPRSDQLWVVTKQLAHGRLYALPAPLSATGVNVATKVRREGGMVTDGAVSPDGSRYVLRDYVNATIFDGLPPGRQEQSIPLPFQVQGEAVTWTEDGSALLIASERDDRLIRVEVGGAVASAAPPPSDAPSESASPAASPTDATGVGAGVWVIAGFLVCVAALVIAIAERGRRRGRA